MNIYVGNLSAEVTDSDLKEAFEAFGQVKSAKVIKDMFSGDSRGFGFVEMAVGAEAQKAIDSLNTTELKGKKLVVNEARPKNKDNSRPRTGQGGGGGGFRRGGPR